MERSVVRIGELNADAYVVPLGPVNLVFAVRPDGMVGCGAFDVEALDRFGYAAAKVRAANGGGIATVADLLDGVVAIVNKAAAVRGVTTGMSGRAALQLL